MNAKKRILIFTADAGFGHRSAANAVAAALEEAYPDQCQVKISNPLDDHRTPFFLRDSQSDYDTIIRNAPELYRFGYDASDSTVPNAILESTLAVLLYEVIRDELSRFRPDAVITTYPLYQAPLDAVFTIRNFQIPLLTVVTDLATVHRVWFHNAASLCLAPTQEVRDLAVKYDLNAEKVIVTGLPVSTEILRERRDRTTLRQSLGWDPHLPTLLAVGSRRVDNLLETLDVINHYGSPLQLAVVAGRDADLYAQLKAVDWHVPAHIYEYAANVPTMMRAADLIVCKAGGLIVTEALASGLPMLLIDALPGQETGNAEYVVSNGAGVLVPTPIETLRALSHWLMHDQRELRQAAQNARAVGKPEAAYTIAHLAWEAAQKGPSPSAEGPTAGRLPLIDLLTRFHVDWQENLLSPGKKKP